jgi:acetoacetyl-CoA reductase
MARIALVTGGTRGLGRAIAVALKAQGCTVAAVYRGNDEAARQLQTEHGIRAYKWDVGDFDACALGVAQVEREIGPIDILVNNAGITSDVSLHHMTREQWQRVIDVNLGSMFNMCRHVIEGMRERNFGRIVNISSINGQKGQFGQVNYAATKAGILGFTRALALEGARKNVTVNAIAPGYCDTDMVSAVSPDVLKTVIAGIPVGRLGAPADVARTVIFLSQDEAGFVTGATFSINGGEYMS